MASHNADNDGRPVPGTSVAARTMDIFPIPSGVIGQIGVFLLWNGKTRLPASVPSVFGAAGPSLKGKALSDPHSGQALPPAQEKRFDGAGRKALRAVGGAATLKKPR